MSTPDSEQRMDPEEVIRRQASDWILLQDRGFTPDEQDAFSRWLAEDFRHRAQYKKRLQLWNRIGQIRSAPESLTMREEAASLEPRGLRGAPRATRWVATAACLGLGAIGWFAWMNLATDESVTVAHFAANEGYERHTLEDGSLVELNDGAAVSIEYRARSRVILQESGEAHFTVSHDTSRPFLVHAGGSVIRAVGTAFNVHLDKDSLEVLVTEGRVELTRFQGGPAQKPKPETETFSIELEQGQRSLVPKQRDGLRLGREAVSTVELEKLLEWKHPLIQFTKQPLSRVIAEFNRYNDTQIQLGEAAVGERTLTAALRMNNLEGFIQLLEAGMRIQADRADESRIVLRSRDTH